MIFLNSWIACVFLIIEANVFMLISFNRGIYIFVDSEEVRQRPANTVDGCVSPCEKTEAMDLDTLMYPNAQCKDPKASWIHTFKEVIRLQSSVNTFPVMQKLAISRIMFASCNRQNEWNPFWSVILHQLPNIFIWMGDTVYADYTDEALDEIFQNFELDLFHSYEFFTKRIKGFIEKRSKAAEPFRLREAYSNLSAIPEYAAITAIPNISIVGTWDDHDMGIDNANRYFPHRYESKKEFLDFFNEPENSPRRSPEREGIYESFYYDFGGQHRSVCVILLDCRYNLDPRYKEGDILGEQQWKWLEDVMHSSNATVNIIVSSIQILAENRVFTETWSRSQTAQKRLLNLILDSNVSAPILLSGDVHFAEIQGKYCWSTSNMDLPVLLPIYEITSSGMTHSFAGYGGPLLYMANALLSYWLPLKTMLIDPVSGKRMVKIEKNAGEIEILWNPLYNKSFENIEKSSAVVIQLYEAILSNLYELSSVVLNTAFPYQLSPYLEELRVFICIFLEYPSIPEFQSSIRKLVKALRNGESVSSLTEIELKNSFNCKLFTNDRITPPEGSLKEIRGWLIVRIYGEHSGKPILQKIWNLEHLTPLSNWHSFNKLTTHYQNKTKTSENEKHMIVQRMESSHSFNWECMPIHGYANTFVFYVVVSTSLTLIFISVCVTIPFLMLYFCLRHAFFFCYNFVSKIRIQLFVPLFYSFTLDSA